MSSVQLDQPHKRYFDLIDSVVEAFLQDNLIQKHSDKDFIGSYIYHKTGKRNGGWYAIYLNNTEGVIDGFDDEISEEDRLCYEAIDYTDDEKTVLIKKFDNARNVFSGLMITAEAAYRMEKWEGKNKFNLLELLYDTDRETLENVFTNY